MIQLKEVLHYYIGQKCEVSQFDGKNKEIVTIHGVTYGDNGEFTVWDKHSGYGRSWDKALLVRPISSLTDDEKVKLFDAWLTVKEFSRAYKINRIDNVTNSHEPMNYTPAAMHYLLSIGIDLFNLLSTGQAKETI